VTGGSKLAKNSVTYFMDGPWCSVRGDCDDIDIFDQSDSFAL